MCDADEGARVWVLKSKRTIYRVSALTRASPGARNVGGGIGSGTDDRFEGVLTSCMTPEYQRPSGPGAHTLVPIMERLARRRLVDIVLVLAGRGKEEGGEKERLANGAYARFLLFFFFFQRAPHTHLSQLTFVYLFIFVLFFSFIFLGRGTCIYSTCHYYFYFYFLFYFALFFLLHFLCVSFFFCDLLLFREYLKSGKRFCSICIR